MKNGHTRAQALATYLQALALLGQSNDTYVKQEIREAIAEIKRELALKN